MSVISTMAKTDSWHAFQRAAAAVLFRYFYLTDLLARIVILDMRSLYNNPPMPLTGYSNHRPPYFLLGAAKQLACLPQADADLCAACGFQANGCSARRSCQRGGAAVRVRAMRRSCSSTEASHFFGEFVLTRTHGLAAHQRQRRRRQG